MKLNKSINYFLFLVLSAIIFTACNNETENFNNHIYLKGEDNFRDLGGYEAEGGKKVIYRKLFRSGELSQLTTSDTSTLTRLYIEQAIDLRTEEEQIAKPDNLPQGIAFYNIPVLSTIPGVGALSEEEQLGSLLSGEINAQEFMMALYSTIDSTKILAWKKIFNLLETGKPTLWHCTEGKDRAGMTSALVLFSLGVDEETVIEDYMASNTYLAESIEQNIAYMNSEYGEDKGDIIRHVLGVEKEYIVAFINAVKEKYGSIDEFLNVLDVDKEKMKANYLE